jgi:predicted lipoprotein with Yx(FWY)xxD motif
MRLTTSWGARGHGWRRATFALLLFMGLGAALGACNSGTVTTLTTPPTTNDSLALTVQHSPGGLILATGSGATLYDFVPDTPTHSACLNAGCVFQWPPYEVAGTVRVGPGVDWSLVGHLTRPDGTVQLSYDGHPLYTYIRDTKPGVVTGQAIDQDGGLWYVLSPRGKEIHTPFTVNR